MNTKVRTSLLACFIATGFVSMSSAADRPLNPGELEQEIANPYGKFSIDRDRLAESVCCTEECPDRPGPWKTRAHCSLSASAQSGWHSQLRADLESKPSDALASKPQSVATTNTPSDGSPTDPNRFRTTPPDMTQKVIDMIHPGLGRWEKTIGQQHVRVNYLNVKRCRGRDPHHQDICVGINVSTTF